MRLSKSSGFLMRVTLGMLLALATTGIAPSANAIDDKKVASDMSLIFDELIVLRADIAKLNQRVKTLEKEKTQQEGDTYIFVPTNSVQPGCSTLEYNEKKAPWVLKEVK